MTKQIIQPINNFNRILGLKYENIDSLDLIESKKCTEEGCQQYEFSIGSLSYFNVKNPKYYFKQKLDDLKLQTVDYRTHFKTPCFNCSSSFHGSSFDDGHFNLQKMPENRKKCSSCQRNYTKERSFYHNCNICNASFKNCHLLVHHRSRDHNSKKPQQCAACHLSLSDGALSHHIFKHKRPFICSYCSKSYATKMNFKLHLLSHTGERPFSCKHCPKQFKIKQSLDYHLFEHTGGKQFKCDLCDKSFAKGYMLNRHKRIHVEKSFQCKICFKFYKTPKYISDHIRRVHKSLGYE